MKVKTSKRLLAYVLDIVIFLILLQFSNIFESNCFNLLGIFILVNFSQF